MWMVLRTNGAHGGGWPLLHCHYTHRGWTVKYVDDDDTETFQLDFNKNNKKSGDEAAHPQLYVDSVRVTRP